MRLGILAGSFVLMISAARGQAPLAPIPEGPKPQATPDPIAGQLKLINPSPRQAHQGFHPGLTSGSKPRILTLQEAYWLALLKSLDAKKIRAIVPDPKDLADGAAKAGFTDFEPFRKVFLARSGEATFHDPAPSFLNLLRRSQDLESCALAIESMERLVKLNNQRYGEEARPADDDHTRKLLQETRSYRLDALLAYQKALDDFKIELGLSLDVEIAPDRSLLAPIQQVFEAIEDFMAEGSHDIRKLPQIVDRLPKPADLKIDALSLAECRRKDDLSPFFSVAKKRRATITERDLAQVRSRIRTLAQFPDKAQIDRSRLVLSASRRDSALMNIVAPPAGATDVQGDVMILVDQVRDAVLCKDRIVRDWAESQALRVELYRDLGILPYDDWPSFLKSF